MRWLYFILISSFVWARPIVKIAQVRTHNFPTVVAEVSVGSLLPFENLQANHFTVYEDKNPVTFKLEVAEEVKEPLRLILLLDTSLSIRPKDFKEEIRSAINFVSMKPEKDSLAVITFDDEPRLVVDFTHDKDEIINQMKKIRQNGKHTALYDALLFAFNKIEEARKKFKNAREAILIFTDGREETSQIKIDDLLHRVERLQVPVYVAGTGHRKKLKPLTRLAKYSGGEAYHVARHADFEKIFQILQMVFQKNYILTYESLARFSKEKPRAELKVEVNIPNLEGKNVVDEDRYFFYLPEIQETAKVSPFSWDIRYLYFLVGLIIVLLLLILFILLKQTPKVQEQKEEPKLKEKEKTEEEKPKIRPLPPAVQAYLVEKEGPHTGRKHKILYNSVTLGSSKDSDIVIADETVSLRHAQIQYQDGFFVVYDLISENGTYLNGKKLLRPKRLHDFDELQVGLTKLIFRQG